MSDLKDFSDNEYEEPDREPTSRWIYEIYRDIYDPLFIFIKDERNERDEKVKICVRKVKKNVHDKYYKKCKTELVQCHWCQQTICPNKDCIPQYILRSYSSIYPSKIHDKCVECLESITCCPSGICRDCEKNHTYDMITEHVAIGSYQASYESFDLVINLDYPENNVKFGEVVHSTHKIKHIKEDIKEDKDIHVIKCGYNDISEGGGSSNGNLRRSIIDRT